MPVPVQTPEQAVEIANTFRVRGVREYHYVTVSETATVRFFATREDQIADGINTSEYKVFRLRYTDGQGAVYIDNVERQFLSTESNVEQ